MAKKDIPLEIKAGDQFYLDAAHKDHLEVFDKKASGGKENRGHAILKRIQES